MRELCAIGNFTRDTFFFNKMRTFERDKYIDDVINQIDIVREQKLHDAITRREPNCVSWLLKEMDWHLNSFETK